MSIQERINEVIDGFNIKKIPVDLEEILKTNNISLDHEDLEDHLSGYCMKSSGNASVTINQNHHSNRQNFTIAHELGHLFLHCEDEGVFIEQQSFNRDKQSSTGEIKEEVEANRFASCLLMPEKFVREIAISYKGSISEKEVNDMANEFEVSSMAMCYRLNKLGIINFFL